MDKDQILTVKDKETRYRERYYNGRNRYSHTVATKEDIKQTEDSMEIEETTTMININQGIITMETNVRTTVIMDNNQQMNMQQEQIIYQSMDDDKNIMVQQQLLPLCHHKNFVSFIES
ncbi:unnamed protein product [Rhizophagus irregularis]|nr:unnamed protein product [Rhizophagus irregularis]